MGATAHRPAATRFDAKTAARTISLHLEAPMRRRPAVLSAPVGLLCLIAACSGDLKVAAEDATSGPVGPTCSKVTISEPAEATASSDLLVPVSVLGDGFDVRGAVIRPASCTAAAPGPLVVIVPDRDASPWPNYAGPAALLAGNAKVVVAIFNLPGTGPGGLASKGTQDYGGTYHVTAVKEVMRVVLTRNYVDATKAGYISLGFGLVPVAAALKLFGPNSLKEVLFLIDVEGPVDRCSASASPEDTDKGIGPDHGPGASDTACHIDKDTSMAEVFPAGRGEVPTSVTCAPAAWPITKTGKDCTDDWWSLREPATALKALPVRYQRLQFRHDHRQATPWSSRVAMSAVAQSKACPYFGLNDMAPCQTPLSNATCAGLTGGQQCWLEGTWGNGMAPAPYAAATLCEVTPEALFALVLPKYVARMVDTVAFKNCK